MNYIGTCRSNHFKVKDPGAFRAWALGSGLRVFPLDERYPDCVALYADGGGGWPGDRETFTCIWRGRILAEDGAVLFDGVYADQALEDFPAREASRARAIAYFESQAEYDPRVHPTIRLESPELDEGPQEFDLLGELAEHLVEGEVAILLEAGHAGRRYLVGTASAVNAKGEVRSLDLEDIYPLAAELGPNVTRAEH